MMTTLNRHSSATTPNVAIGTLTMENRFFTAGSCMTAAAAAITAELNAQLFRVFAMAGHIADDQHQRRDDSERNRRLRRGQLPELLQRVRKAPSRERSIVLAMPFEPLIVRFGL